MIGEIRDFETAQIAIQASLTGHLVLATLHTNDATSAITRPTDMGVEPFCFSSLLGVLAQRLVRKYCTHCQGSGCEHRTTQAMPGAPVRAAGGERRHSRLDSQPGRRSPDSRRGTGQRHGADARRRPAPHPHNGTTSREACCCVTRIERFCRLWCCQSSASDKYRPARP